MLQLFPTQNLETVGEPTPLRSTLGSVFFHAIAMLFLLSIRYWYVDVLPERFTRVMLVAPMPPPPPPPPAPVVKASRIPVSRAVRAFSPVLSAPAAIPQHAVIMAPGVDLPPDLGTLAGVPGGVPGGIPGGVSSGIMSGVLPSAPPPPPPVRQTKVEKPPEPSVPTRIKVDSEIQAGLLLSGVQPEYPPMAKQARIQGPVHMTAVIDREGRITELKVLEGNPLLVGAARNAVQRWRYRPTLLHGEPVEVMTEIIVNFRLQSL